MSIHCCIIVDMSDHTHPHAGYQNLTQHEIKAMRTEHNLAAAHARKSQSPTQKEIIKRLPQLWHEAEKTSQREMEERFVQAFFRSQRQPTALTTPTMLVYSSSVALVMAANFLALKKMRVSLLEPCFDAIYSILCNQNLPIDKPLAEEWLHDPEKIYENLKKQVHADAIIIVEPNNPTGFTLGRGLQTLDKRKRGYLELIRYAKDHDKLLVLDLCFSSFLLEDAKPASFDIYKDLEESGVSYIVVEDTGKTWPLQDTKVAMLKSSKNVHDDLFNIHTSFLLSVSPFILNLATQYIVDSEADEFSSALELLKRNRGRAREVLSGSLLELQEPLANISVGWFRIKDPSIKASNLHSYIRERGVYILPGTHFFWSDHAKGERFVRIALARDPRLFDAAIRKLRTILDEFAQTQEPKLKSNSRKP